MIKIISRTTLLLFFLLILIFFRFDKAYADFTIIAIPSDHPQNTSLTGDDWENWSGSVNDNTKLVKIAFSNLNQQISYKACLKKNPKDCSGGDNLKDLPANPVNGSVDLFVCGDGPNDLKFADKTTSDCADSDYFHGQKDYSLSLFNKDTPTAPLETANFYTYRYYPVVDIQPEKPSPGIPFTVVIKGSRRPYDKDYRNNYLIRLNDIRNDTLDKYCIDVHEDYTNEVTFSETDGSSVVNFSVPEGDYVLKIEDRVHDSSANSFEIKSRDKCSGEFVYYQAIIKVREGGGSIELQADPNGQDLSTDFGKEHKGPPPPCDKQIDIPSENCPKVQTAVGPIETKPEAFVKSLFGLVLGLSGGIALLLIIYGGYQLMASRGKPEAMEAARDQITAAIIGLLFIIFALVILQVVGYDILKIPGFK